jgi:twitching motility two-component system response regulator PilH
MAIKRIMVVDDSPTERHVLNDFLTRKGFEVIIAENGEQAIEKAKVEKPDLILMDVVMPGVNGYQATRTITRNDSTRDIPVIMCTSKDLPTDRIWGMRQGALDYMVKPVNLEDLLGRIQQLGAADNDG